MSGTHGTGGSILGRDGILPWKTLAGSQGKISAQRPSLPFVLPPRKGTKGLNWWDLSISHPWARWCGLTSQHSMGAHPSCCFGTLTGMPDAALSCKGWVRLSVGNETPSLGLAGIPSGREELQEAWHTSPAAFDPAMATPQCYLCYFLLTLLPSSAKLETWFWKWCLIVSWVPKEMSLKVVPWISTSLCYVFTAQIPSLEEKQGLHVTCNCKKI